MIEKIIGISYQKGKIRHTTIEKNGADLTYKLHGVIKYDAELSVDDLTDRWRLDFDELFQSQAPDIVSSIEVIESKSRNSARFQILPFGITALCCRRRNIRFRAFSPQAFVHPGPFGLPAGSKPIMQVDAQFGAYAPHWDDIQRKSVLAAWKAGLE